MATDRIMLTGMQFYGYHGVNPEERALGRPFVVDLDAEVDLSAAAASDQLGDTVSYTDLFRIAKAVLEGEPRHLLETLAGAIAGRALDEHHAVTAIRVRVHKPGPAIKGSVIAAAAVEIYRSR